VSFVSVVGRQRLTLFQRRLMHWLVVVVVATNGVITRTNGKATGGRMIDEVAVTNRFI
jgi:hypothetical protein